MAVADLSDLGIVDEDEAETRKQRGRRGKGGDEREDRRGGGDEREKKEFEERVVQVSRVTKVVKGGKQMSFRAVVVVGDEKGKARGLLAHQKGYRIVRRLQCWRVGERQAVNAQCAWFGVGCLRLQKYIFKRC